MKKFGLIVRQSRHPQLNEFIYKAIKESILNFLKSNTLSKFIIVIKQRDTLKVIEKYVFNLQFQPIEQFNNFYSSNIKNIQNTEMKNIDMNDDYNNEIEMMTLNKIEFYTQLRKQLRNILVKMNVINTYISDDCDKKNKNKNQNCYNNNKKKDTILDRLTWGIEIETSKFDYQSQHTQNWVQKNINKQQERNFQDTNNGNVIVDTETFQLIPVTNCDMQKLSIHAYAQKLLTKQSFKRLSGKSDSISKSNSVTK